MPRDDIAAANLDDWDFRIETPLTVFYVPMADAEGITARDVLDMITNHDAELFSGCLVTGVWEDIGTRAFNPAQVIAVHKRNR